jgi:hypothetical protein
MFLLSEPGHALVFGSDDNGFADRPVCAFSPAPSIKPILQRLTLWPRPASLRSSIVALDAFPGKPADALTY